MATFRNLLLIVSLALGFGGMTEARAADLYYKVRPGDQLGWVLAQFKQGPIWGKNGLVNRTVEVNPSLQSSRGDLIYPKMRIDLPFSSLPGSDTYSVKGSGEVVLFAPPPGQGEIVQPNTLAQDEPEPVKEAAAPMAEPAADPEPMRVAEPTAEPEAAPEPPTAPADDMSDEFGEDDFSQNKEPAEEPSRNVASTEEAKTEEAPKQDDNNNMEQMDDYDFGE